MFPLQGGGAGEQTHRQPHSSEQPLHPSRSREQLLSVSTREKNEIKSTREALGVFLGAWHPPGLRARDPRRRLFVTDRWIRRSVNEDPPPPGLIRNRTPLRADGGGTINNKSSDGASLLNVFLTFAVPWTELQNGLS